MRTQPVFRWDRAWVPAARAVLVAGIVLAGEGGAWAECSSALPGDVTGDGTVDVVDVQCAILGVLAELGGSPQLGCAGGTLDLADINCDGQVSVVDVSLDINLALGKPLGASVDANADGCPDACWVSVCPDGICDDTETCTSCPDDCGACPKPALRIDSLALRDPHAFTPAPACIDVVEGIAGIGLNSYAADSLADPAASTLFLTFANGDPAAPSDIVLVYRGHCDAAGAVCQADPGHLDPLLVTQSLNLSAGICYQAPASTLTPEYLTPPASPAAPCFFTMPGALTIDLAGISVSLEAVTLAGEWGPDGLQSPVVTGVLAGFVSQQEAESIALPDTLPLVGGMTLADLLLNGDAPGGSTCPGDDSDVRNGTPGWWLYFDFTAQPVSWYPL